MSDPHKARKATRLLMQSGKTAGVIAVPIEVMFLTLTSVSSKAPGLNVSTTVYGGEEGSPLPPVGPDTPERAFYVAKDNGTLRSRRDEKSFSTTLKEVNRIWAGANITFKLQPTITSGSFALPGGAAKIDDDQAEAIMQRYKSTDQVIRLIMVPMLSRSLAGISIAPYRSAVICDRAGPVSVAHELGHIFGLDDLNAGGPEPENVMDGDKHYSSGIPLSSFSFVSSKMARSAYCSHNAVVFGADPIDCADVYSDPNIGNYR